MGSGRERCFDVTGAAGHAQVDKRDTAVKKAADDVFNSFRRCASGMLGWRRGDGGCALCIHCIGM